METLGLCQTAPRRHVLPYRKPSGFSFQSPLRKERGGPYAMSHPWKELILLTSHLVCISKLNSRITGVWPFPKFLYSLEGSSISYLCGLRKYLLCLVLSIQLYHQMCSLRPKGIGLVHSQGHVFFLVVLCTWNPASLLSLPVKCYLSFRAQQIFSTT